MPQSDRELKMMILQLRIVVFGTLALIALPHIGSCAQVRSEAGARGGAQGIVQRKESDIEKQYRLALTRFSEVGRLDATLFESLVRDFPESPEAHLLLGNIYSIAEFTENRFEKAFWEYNKAIELRPQFVAAYVNRGVARFVQHEAALLRAAVGTTIPKEVEAAGKKAIEDFDKALSLQPDLFAAHFNKGVVLKMIGKEREAIKSFDLAISLGLKIDPLDQPSVANEGKYQYLSTGYPMCVMSQFLKFVIDKYLTHTVGGRKIVRLSPLMTFISGENDPTAFAHYHKGVSYARANLRNYRAAIESLTAAIKMNPNVPEFYSKRALVYVGTGQAEEMLRDMQKAKDLVDMMVKLVTSQ